MRKLASALPSAGVNSSACPNHCNKRLSIRRTVYNTAFAVSERTGSAIEQCPSLSHISRKPLEHRVSQEVKIIRKVGSGSSRQRARLPGFEQQQYSSFVCHASRASMSDSLEEVRRCWPRSKASHAVWALALTVTMVMQMGLRDRIRSMFRFFAEQPEAKTLMQAAQFASTLLFVVLYIWSTYSPPPLWSIRYNLDLFLCLMFAIDYVSRFLVRIESARDTIYADMP